MRYELPEQFAEFSEARQSGFLKVKELKDNGGLVAGIFCTYTPLEILDAAGFTPVSLCGMSDETIAAAEAHLPKNLCPLIKSSYGFAVSDKCPYTYFSDLIVGETTCDGKKKMYELLGQIKPTYILRLPQGLGPDSVEQWTLELRHFICYLEEHFGVNISDHALREASRKRNEERKSRTALMELQKRVPPPSYGYQIYTSLDGASFLFETVERSEKLDLLRHSLEDAYRNGEHTVSKSRKRILITGCPIGGVLQKTIKALEDCGAVVVCFENCGGIKASFQMVDSEAEDIVEAIARRYLEIACAVISPNTKRTELLRDLVEAYTVDAVIEIDLVACTPYTIEARTVRSEMERLSVPFLSLETDYSKGDVGQLQTRLEDFLETL